MTAGSVPRVVALGADLMDRSRLVAVLPELEVASGAAQAAGADVVLVDLARCADEIAAARAAAPSALIVAYGAHVDDAALTAARRAGADVALPRSRFFRDPAAAIAQAHANR